MINSKIYIPLWMERSLATLALMVSLITSTFSGLLCLSLFSCFGLMDRDRFRKAAAEPNLCRILNRILNPFFFCWSDAGMLEPVE